MDYGRRVLLLLLAVMLSYGVQAQYTEDDGGVESRNGYLRYLGLGAGATYQVMFDEAISPIVYSRVSASPMLNHIKVNESIYTEVSMRASILNLTHNVNKEEKPKVKTQRALVDYRFLFRVPVEMRDFDIRAGGMLGASFTDKNAPLRQDAAQVYEYAVSLGICGKVTKEVVFRDHTTFLTWDVAIPLFANISRPYYLNRQELADPENKIFGDFLKNSTTGSFGKYFRINSRAGFMYRMENGNALQLTYQWDYTRMKTNNKAYFAEHIVSLLFMFNY